MSDKNNDSFFSDLAKKDILFRYENIKYDEKECHILKNAKLKNLLPALLKEGSSCGQKYIYIWNLNKNWDKHNIKELYNKYIINNNNEVLDE